METEKIGPQPSNVSEPIPNTVELTIHYEGKKLQFSELFLDHPLSVCLKVTNRCNFSCEHCLSRNTSHQPPKPGEELTTYELMSAMDLIEKARVPKLNISGGEPFLWHDPIDPKKNDIRVLLEYAKSKKFQVSVTTNGSLVEDEHIKLMKRLDIAPDISLDGPTPEINDPLRGKGSHDKVVNLLKRLKLTDVPYILNCTLQKQNYDALQKDGYAAFDEYVDLGMKHGCTKIYAILFRPQGKATAMTDRELTEKEVHDLRDKIQDYKEKYSGKLSISLMDLRKHPSSFVLIEPDGTVISQSHRDEDNKRAGHLLEQRDLNLIWRESNCFNHRNHLLHYLGA